MSPNKVQCPLVNAEIKDIDCIENSDSVKGVIVKESVPERFKVKTDWEEICRKCKWYNY